MKHMLRTGVLFLAFADLAACGINRKTASKENFARLIAAELPTKEQCTTFKYMGHPGDGWSTNFPLVDTVSTAMMSDPASKRYYDYFAAVEKAGLIRVSKTQINESHGTPTILRIDATDRGRAVFKPIVDTVRMPGLTPVERTSQRMCFGAPELVEVTNFTEHGPNMGGATTSVVEFTYRMKAPEWLTPELARLDPFVGQVLKASKTPQPMQVTAILTAQGWK